MDSKVVDLPRSVVEVADKPAATLGSVVDGPPNIRPPKMPAELGGENPRDNGADFSRYVSSTEGVIIDTKGIPKKKRWLALTEEGKKASEGDYKELARHEDPYAQIRALQNRIKEHISSPKHERVMSEEQRYYYEKLIELSKKQLASMEVAQIEAELAVSGNAWERVIQTRLKGRTERSSSPTPLLDQRRILAGEIQQLREGAIDKLVEDGISLSRSEILKAVQRRSEERREAKQCTSWCRSRLSPYH